MPTDPLRHFDPIDAELTHKQGDRLGSEMSWHKRHASRLGDPLRGLDPPLRCCAEVEGAGCRARGHGGRLCFEFCPGRPRGTVLPGSPHQATSLRPTGGAELPHAPE